MASSLGNELVDYLADQAEQLRLVLEASHDVISLNRWDTTFVVVSPACQRILGYSPEELTGRRAADLVHPDDRERARESSQRLLSGSGPQILEFRMLRKDGEQVWVESTAQPPPAGQDLVAVVTRDITERREWQELLMAAALHDPVTGLANRRLFDERLDAEVARALRGHPGLAVLFVDLDDFKLFNDCHGHAGGDQVLRQVSDRINANIRAGDLAARYGGDEFVVICVDLPSEEEARAAARRLRDALAQPYHVLGHEYIVTASVGVAVWEAPMTAADLLRQADGAMYEAKQSRALRLPTQRRGEVDERGSSRRRGAHMR